MGAAPLASRQPSIPWHRRLEARVLLGVALIAGLSLASVAIITSRVVRTHAFERARTDLTSARAAFTHLIDTRADVADVRSEDIVDGPVFRAHMSSADVSSH